jgi:hypothetical protein
MIICLIMTLPTFSQSLSNDTCSVPCKTLRNALKMKNDYELCKISLSESRDSITILNEIVISQDSLISIKNQTNIILSENNENLNQTVILKDNIINEKDKEIKKVKNNSKKIIGIGGILLLLSLIL